ncbi:MAG: ATP-binding protein, partial [Caulobacteraceae bacterium]
MTLTDFQTGAAGDGLDVDEWLFAISDWDCVSDPFAAGYLRLEQTGPGLTTLQVDLDGAGAAEIFQTLLTLTGTDASGVKKAVVVELKQWQKIQATTKDAIVVTQLGKGLRQVVHPSYQAWSYAALLEGFNEAVYDGGIVIKPCAYLHNYVRDGVIDAPHYAAYIEKAPLFTKGKDERDELRAFIKEHVTFGDAKA